MGTVKGLDIGRRAITTSLNAVNNAGQNIASVNSPGYSRRIIDSKVVAYGSGEAISVQQTHRVRDKFIDQSIRTENQSLGKWDMQSILYRQVEDVFLEPSEHGLNDALSGFWNSWEDLASNPYESAPRSVVVQQGIVVAQSINQLDSQLTELRRTSDNYIGDRIIKVNDLADRIGELNVRIVATEASGKEASDARDNRDLLIDEMSRMVNTHVIEREGGSIAVFVGGRTIVDDATVVHLEAKRVASGNMMVSELVWEDDATSANINNGEIAGLMQMRDEIITGVMAKMDQLAATLITEVNAIHRTGYGSNGATNIDFFTGTSASDMAVNDEIVGNMANVAASENDEPGSNGVARAMAELANANVAPGAITIGAFYSSTVNLLGTRAQSANMMRDNSEMLVAGLKEQRESVSGISLDEETANLIRFQRAYESAAHYISVVDELLASLIEIV